MHKKILQDEQCEIIGGVGTIILWWEEWNISGE